MATTVDPKPHSPSNRSGTNHPGAVKARISALVSSLHGFDVSTIERRNDWKADAFASLFNATLADIFGQNSQEYEEYSVRSFDTLPPAKNVEYPLPEVRQGYQKGINAAIRKLNLLRDALDNKPGVAEEKSPPARQAAAAPASSADGKISLVARRAEVKSRQVTSAAADATAPGHGKAAKAALEVGVSVEIVIDGLPEELQPKEDKARPRNQGIADILGNNGKESGQREDMVREYLEAMQRALESGKFGEEKNAQGGLETAEIKADEDLAVDGLLEAMQRAVEGARPGEEWIVQDEPDTAEIKADEETRPLEPEGIVSAEFSYQEPCAGPLPDKPPEDEPGREALLSGDEAIVLGAPELPEALAEDRQETTPWSPGAELAIGMSAARVEPSAALTSLDPLESAEVAIAAGEENDVRVALSSPHLAEKRIGDIETGLPEPTEQAADGKTTESRVGPADGFRDHPTADTFRRKWSGMKARISALVSASPARHPVAATIQPGAQEDKETRPLEPEGFVSAEFSYEDPWAGSLPGEPPKDELGKEALTSGDEAIVLGAPELPEPVVEDRQGRAPWGPGAELTMEMGQETRPLEPEGFVSAEFSYEDPWAGSLPGEPPKDELDKEALLSGDEAIVLGAPELPEPVVEDRQGRAPWGPGAELTMEVSAEHVEPSTELMSLDPLESAEVAMAAGEENDVHVAPLSPHLSHASASELLREEPPTLEHDPFSHAAAEQMTEPSWHEIPAHEPLSIEQVAGEPEKPDQGIIFDAVEDELPAAYLEQATEPISISSLDLRDVEALADRFAEGIAGPSEPKAPEVPEERLSVDAVRVPAGLDQSKEAASSRPAEDLAEAVPEPVIKAPEVEQNPFAIKDFEKKQARPKAAGAADLKTQIRAIMERIDDLKGFDVSTVSERFDPRARALRDSANNTIAEVFGRNTPAYWHHSLPEFDTVPVVLGSPRPPSPEEVRGSYLRAIDKAVAKLTAIVKSLKQRLEKLEKGATSENDSAAAPPPDRQKDTVVAEQQEKAVQRPVERVVIKVPDVEQNPFAIRDFEKKQPRPEAAGPVDLQTQVGAIMERINDLRSFDLTTVAQRYDPKARELCNSVNNTIADVFGRNTPAYWHHSLSSFEAAYAIVGSPNRSPDDLRRSYEEGINKAVTKLTAIAESLKSKLQQSESCSST
ncbi:MAG: hypothetical protein ABSD38_07195 [Syntrophorhabdales bacterium]